MGGLQLCERRAVGLALRGSIHNDAIETALDLTLLTIAQKLSILC